MSQSPDKQKVRSAQTETFNEASDADRDSDCESTSEDSAPISRSYMKHLLESTMKPLLKEMSELRSDIRHIGHRVESLEYAQVGLIEASNALGDHLQMHRQHLNSVYLALEDQKNRSRRKNIRIRGIPKSFVPEALHKVSKEIFADILGPDRANTLIIERVHRALRPKTKVNERPRDIICGLLSYVDTAAILTDAREKAPLIYNDANFQIFQDISPATLSKRKILKPLTDAILNHGLRFKWLFPFGVGITKEGHQITIRTPEDLDAAWESLQIDPISIPSWMPLDMGVPIPHLDKPGDWSTKQKSASPKVKRRMNKS
ncbi:uncharacterized protein [Dendrobates tinctorius]|uniref:uncharacterized protein n=1 Tax=Dendrobates tinctorius TaxID=92724 RepID=UPI003CC9C90A